MNLEKKKHKNQKINVAKHFRRMTLKFGHILIAQNVDFHEKLIKIFSIEEKTDFFHVPDFTKKNRPLSN